MSILDLYCSVDAFDDPAITSAQYARLKRRIAHLSEQSPLPTRFGEETIYHFILRQATTIAANVGMDGPEFHGDSLTLEGDFRIIPPLGTACRTVLDTRESLIWAQRALRSIAAEQWLLITWQVTPDGYQLSVL
jgi:hypothetical protein